MSKARKKFVRLNSLDAVKKRERFLQASGEDYRKTTNGSFTTVTLETDDKVFRFSKNSVPPSELSFIKRVKEEGKRFWDREKYNYDSEITSKDIDYYQASESFTENRQVVERLADSINAETEGRGQVFDVIEIDVNSAYFKQALNMGVISEETFDLSKEVSKYTRLAALGSLGKVTHEWRYSSERGEKVSMPDSVEETRPLYLSICNAFSKNVMQPVFKKNTGKVYFFWVDAFFVCPSIKDFVIEELDSSGFGYSIEEFDSMYFEAGKAILTRGGEIEKYIYLKPGKVDQVRVSEIYKRNRDFIDSLENPSGYVESIKDPFYRKVIRDCLVRQGRIS